jgi:hypothetical protein
MKIKIKGTNKEKTVTPNEWSVIEKNGNAPNFEIIERNTVWLAPIDSVGEMVESHKREFELEHWHKLLDLGSKNKWREINAKENGIENPKKEVNELVKSEIKDKVIEISDLQAELTQAQINESRAKTELTTTQTKDLKRKWVYFFIGAVIGNLKYIIELFQ